MAHPNYRLYEPGPMMTRIAKEPRATKVRQLLERIEDQNPEKNLTSFVDQIRIKGEPIEFQCLRRHFRQNDFPVVDLTATAEFQANGKTAYAIEILSVTKAPTYNPNNIRSTLEVSIAGRMAESHLQMCLGRSFGEIIECQGFFSVLSSRNVTSIRHELGSQGEYRLRFSLDDLDRRQRVRLAHHPEVLGT